MIETHGLAKRYGPVLAVDDLTLTVKPGRVTGFLGPNGAGKSTTMRLLLGLARPDAGIARINGRPYRELRHPLHEVGALLEAQALHPGRTARHHLLWLAHSAGIPRARVESVLELTGISAAADRRAGGLSLGMAQRLGLAAALLGDPPVLILDEPMNGLDPEGILWIRALLRSLATQGRTLLISSHLMSEMSQLADHLIVIARGRLIADTTTATFTDRHARGHVRVASPDAERLARLLRAEGATVTARAPDGDLGGGLAVTGMDCATVGDLAARHGLTIHHLSEHRPSLEEAFIRLTRDPPAGPQAPAHAQPEEAR